MFLSKQGSANHNQILATNCFGELSFIETQAHPLVYILFMAASCHSSWVVEIEAIWLAKPRAAFVGLLPKLL